MEARNADLSPFAELIEQGLETESIRIESKTDNSAETRTSDERTLSEFFARQSVRDVHLDRRSRNRAQSIAQGHRSMRIAPGIDQYAIGRKTHLMDAVDQQTLDIALKILELHFGKPLFQSDEIIVKAHTSVELGLSPAQQIEIGTVNYLNLHFPKLQERGAPSIPVETKTRLVFLKSNRLVILIATIEKTHPLSGAQIFDPSKFI